MIFWAALAAMGFSAGLSALLVPTAKRFAFRTGMLDRPQAHKTHEAPVPLLGGSAILLAVLLPSVLATALACYWSVRRVPGWLPDDLALHVPGLASRAPAALAILGGAVALHVLGLVDDRRPLGPWGKLAVQLGVCLAVTLLADLRVLTVAGPTLSVLLTVLWLGALVNAFNFLDNMDGLSAGVAVICGVALLGAAASVGQYFVAGLLCVIVGAIVGFWPYNYPPASIYMGDAGSMVIGLLLAAASCLTTYTRPGEASYLYGVFVPVIVMAVPLYDTASVMLLRFRAGERLMVGDQRHFSHRLVRRGMTKRTAVLTIYLCTAGTAIGALLLPRVADATGAMLIVFQTLAILGIVALLESGGSRS